MDPPPLPVERRRGRGVVKRRSVQRWRLVARAGDPGNRRRPRGIVDRWTERAWFASRPDCQQEWERRGALAGAKRVPPSPRLDRAIDAFQARRRAKRSA